MRSLRFPRLVTDLPPPPPPSPPLQCGDMTTSSSASGGLRILQTRVVLLALPGLVALLYLTSAYYNRDISTERVSWLPNTLSHSPNQATTAQSASEQPSRRNECWAQWFNTGTVCQSPPQQWSQQDSLDLLWTWSNITLAQQSHATSANKPIPASDLLRYSFRSAQQNMHNGFGSITILTPDVASSAKEALLESNADCTHSYQDGHLGSTHTGQRPCWLASVHPVFKPPSLLHHRQLACSSKSAQPDQHICQQSSSSSSSVLSDPDPSTTSLLAAQADELSDVRLVVSPHHIFADDVSSSDFWSPLYGPTFRLTGDASATGEIQTSNQNHTDPVDAPLIRASRLLDSRFTPRTRRKLLDLPQPLSSSLVKEMYQLWPQELSLAASASSRNVDLAFLTAHYLTEKYREALLWSFVVAKHDTDGDGAFSLSEAKALLQDLGADLAKKFAFPQVEMPIRTTNSKAFVTESLQRANLPTRLGHEAIQTSMDASALFSPPGPADTPSGIVNEEQDGANPLQIHAQNKRPVVPVCTLERECLEPLVELVESSNPQHIQPSTADVFKRVAKQAPVCGDCMIMHLVSMSGTRGLSAFLPSSDLDMAQDKTLPLTSDSQSWEFTLQPESGSPSVKRLDAVSQLLARYVHTIILQEHFVTPQMPNRLETKLGLITLEYFNTSSLFSFKQHGKPADPSKTKPEDAWIWARYVRAWLSLRYPFPMRFESHTTDL